MLELFPVSARVADGQLCLDGIAATELARRFGTPLVVYCAETLRQRVRAVREAVPGTFVVYGAKAFPNVAIMRLLAGEGLGADVASLGELSFARAAGIAGERILVHGNNKGEEELRAAAEAGATVVLDSESEAARAAAAGVARVLVRVTLGVEANTHVAVRTGQHGSKFGLPPHAALRELGEARAAGLEAAGLHIHLGSQLPDARAHLEAIELLAVLAERCRSELDWTPRIVDLGGGFAIRSLPDESEPELAGLAATIVAALRRAWSARALPEPEPVLELGRSLVGPAGVTLYRVGTIKRLPSVTWVAVDGGMSDNPRPQLYGARYTALVADRAAAPADGVYSVAGLHCESGDVLIDEVALPAPRRGDVLAVPRTGAYTLAMASNYNAVPRPAAVLLEDGEASLIRRRETVADLLALEL